MRPVTPNAGSRGRYLFRRALANNLSDRSVCATISLLVSTAVGDRDMTDEKGDPMTQARTMLSCTAIVSAIVLRSCFEELLREK